MIKTCATGYNILTFGPIPAGTCPSFAFPLSPPNKEILKSPGYLLSSPRVNRRFGREGTQALGSHLKNQESQRAKVITVRLNSKTLARRISSVAEGDGIRKSQFRYSSRSVRLKQISWSSAHRQAVRQWRANAAWVDENISCKCY